MEEGSTRRRTELSPVTNGTHAFLRLSPSSSDAVSTTPLHRIQVVSVRPAFRLQLLYTPEYKTAVYQQGSGERGADENRKK